MPDQSNQPGDRSPKTAYSGAQKTRMAGSPVSVSATCLNLGYRRYEWKCDALKQASHKAAERLGLTYVFPVRLLFIKVVPTIQTGCPSLKNGQLSNERLEAQLDPSNFDNGQQKQSLREIAQSKQRNKRIPRRNHDSERVSKLPWWSHQGCRR